ncbi:MAG: 50S ribosomal protein L15 [Patescibacteria group bacterium]
MKLHTLKGVQEKSKRRVGRGSGSGRGKTAGRGTKGQRARGRIRAGFEGGQLPLYKRLPLYRGRGKNRPRGEKSLVVNLKMLAKLPANSIVDAALLVKVHILASDVAAFPIKILGDGELSQPLIIKLPISKSARVKVEKAGGKIEA